MFVQDVSLRLVAAWLFALGDRNAEALQIARVVIDDSRTSATQLMVAMRVAGGAAMYADQLGSIPALVAKWPPIPDPIGEPLYAVSPLNARAFVALHCGATAEVRELAARILGYGTTGSLRLAAAFAQAMVGLSHLVDGDPIEAEAALRPALARAEKEEGRRSVVAGLFAAVLAAAVLERDDPAAAQALLANRLDVIEALAPDAILAAYRTLTYAALSQGDERRAQNTLAGLDALAERRQLPRLRMHALAEQIRIHAQSDHRETVERLIRELDQLVEVFRQEAFSPFLPQYRLVCAIAKAHAALAIGDLERAEQQLCDADALSTQLHRRRDSLTVKVLRAVVARQRNDSNALPLLAEALSLARIGGIVRLLADTHPLAENMAAELPNTFAGTQILRHGDPVLGPSTAGDASSRPAVLRHGLLTAKESEVLNLLDKGMSNKLIARGLDISNETVKWHLKNVFLKLSAGTRKHAVDRARLLGLVGT